MNASGALTRSLWMLENGVPRAPRLQKHMTCDSVVVGSGMAGLSTAYELALAGHKVIVIDRGPLLGGMTSRTTAHLAPVCDDGLSGLIDLRGEEIAKQFQQSQEAAVARIEEHVKRLSVDCDFRRLDAFLFPAPGMKRDKAREFCKTEYDAAKKAGARVNKVTGCPLKGHEKSPCLKYPQQATFHPLKYLFAIIKDLQARGGALFADSPVTMVAESGDAVQVRTESGWTVSAAQGVVATNAPINDRVALHSKMAPYRTYAMAFELAKGAIPDALYWDMADPYHYIRISPGAGRVDHLIVGGEDHRSGEADDGEVRFTALEGFIRGLVPELGKEVTRWSGQVMDTIDYCGFIGRNPGSEKVFVATGDSGQGITHGALAGMLLRDVIVDEASSWEEVYNPSRKTPAGILNFARENLTTVQNLAEYVMPGELGSANELKPGEGGTMRDGLRILAICKDLDGKLHRHSAACSHLGCIVHWNSTEQCWDCPCHGSQFAPDGSVLNGPATVGLGK